MHEFFTGPQPHGDDDRSKEEKDAEADASLRQLFLSPFGDATVTVADTMGINTMTFNGPMLLVYTHTEDEFCERCDRIHPRPEIHIAEIGPPPATLFLAEAAAALLVQVVMGPIGGAFQGTFKEIFRDVHNAPPFKFAAIELAREKAKEKLEELADGDDITAQLKRLDELLGGM